MEWLLAHVGEAIPAPSTAVHIDPAQPQEQSPTEPPSIDPENSPSASTTTADADPEAKSLKCDECNRLFKTQLEVEFHAAKSGHSSFSESTEEKKPLTEEEKVAQLSLLEEKLRQKRLAREQADKQEAQQAEKVRIKMGKEMAEAKRKLEEQEMAKIVEQRRREKEEEKMARDRVRAQIEADKANRKAKMDATSPTAATAPAVVSSPPSHKSPPGSAGPKKDYATTKIQIRLPDGTAVTEEFNAKENLAAVKVFIEINHYDLPFRLMTAYPRKVFGDADLETPLAALGENEFFVFYTFVLFRHSLLFPAHTLIAIQSKSTVSSYDILHQATRMNGCSWCGRHAVSPVSVIVHNLQNPLWRVHKLRLHSHRVAMWSQSHCLSNHRCRL